MGRLVIYGAGGFGREVLTVARAEQREVVMMSDEAQPAFDGVPVIAAAEIRDDDEVVIAISDPNVRRELASRIGRAGRLIDPTAIIGRQVEIGEGAIICEFTCITTSAKIGRHFHLNGYSFVAHDCVIGDYVTFAAAVQCNGNVHIRDGAQIGSGAIIRNGAPGAPIVIGEGAVIGMGSVVTRSVPPHATVIGNPAKPLLRTVEAAQA
jgi:hypothetical protein